MDRLPGACAQASCSVRSHMLTLPPSLLPTFLQPGSEKPEASGLRPTDIVSQLDVVKLVSEHKDKLELVMDKTLEDLEIFEVRWAVWGRGGAGIGDGWRREGLRKWCRRLAHGQECRRWELRPDMRLHFVSLKQLGYKGLEEHRHGRSEGQGGCQAGCMQGWATASQGVSLSALLTMTRTVYLRDRAPCLPSTPRPPPWRPSTTWPWTTSPAWALLTTPAS